MIFKKLIKITTFYSFLCLSPLTFSQSECKNEMDAYSKVQIITVGLMNKITDPNLREITEHYGTENKKAEALMKQGKYQEACDVYQAVIDKYGFKSMEEQYYEQNPDKRPENQTTSELESSSSGAASTMEGAAATSSTSSAAE